MVVLKGMFTLEELEKEPELLIELKEDVREEAATLGEVTSIVIYDVSAANILSHPSSSIERSVRTQTLVAPRAETHAVSVADRQKEPDGVMTIKFKSGISAQACIQKMDGRYFGGQRVCLLDPLSGSIADGQISAAVYTGRERFKRSGAGGLDDDDDEESEQRRLDNFAHWLVEGENEEV